MTTLKICSDGSGGGEGWKGASGCACIVSLVQTNDDSTADCVVLFVLALHIPEEIPISSKIGEWLGLLIGLWEVENWLDDYTLQQQQNAGSLSLECPAAGGDSSSAHTSLRRFFFQKGTEDSLSSLPHCLEVVGDSKGMIKILRDERALQLIHVWEQPAVAEARRVLSKLKSRIQTSNTKPQTKFTWIPRNENGECDALSKRARKEPQTRDVSAETCQRAMSLITNQVIPRRNEYVAMREECSKKKPAKKKQRRI